MGGEKRCTDVRNDVIWLKSILHRFQNFNFPFFYSSCIREYFFLISLSFSQAIYVLGKRPTLWSKP